MRVIVHVCCMFFVVFLACVCVCVCVCSCMCACMHVAAYECLDVCKCARASMQVNLPLGGHQSSTVVVMLG